MCILLCLYIAQAGSPISNSDLSSVHGHTVSTGDLKHGLHFPKVPECPNSMHGDLIKKIIAYLEDIL